MTITSGTLPASSSTTTTNSSAASTTKSPVAPAPALSSGAMAHLASQLAMESGVIATLGGSTSSSPVYDAIGLYNTIAQAAGTASSAQNGTSSSATGSGSTAGSTASGSTSSSSGSTSSSSAQTAASTSATPNINAQWASVIKAHPNMTATAVQDAYNQGIVSTFSTTA